MKVNFFASAMTTFMHLGLSAEKSKPGAKNQISKKKNMCKLCPIHDPTRIKSYQLPTNIQNGRFQQRHG